MASDTVYDVYMLTSDDYATQDYVAAVEGTTLAAVVSGTPISFTKAVRIGCLVTDGSGDIIEGFYREVGDKIRFDMSPVIVFEETNPTTVSYTNEPLTIPCPKMSYISVSVGFNQNTSGHDIYVELIDNITGLVAFEVGNCAYSGSLTRFHDFHGIQTSDTNTINFNASSGAFNGTWFIRIFGWIEERK